MTTRGGILIGVVAALVAGASAAAYLANRPEPAPAPAPAPAEAAQAAADETPKTPKLYCQFYVFTEQRPKLGLYFDVVTRDATPTFQQIYIAESNGARTDYDGVSAPRPEWRFDAKPEPKTIASTIMAPDASQAGQHEEDIVIELYRYDPKIPNPTIEASLKNVYHQNLPGKCRQTLG